MSQGCSQYFPPKSFAKDEETVAFHGKFRITVTEIISSNDDYVEKEFLLEKIFGDNGDRLDKPISCCSTSKDMADT